jgi:putative ABC transport system permease protein
LGLVILSIEHRTKEIGIRKVLGADASSIVILVSKEFRVLIAIAFIVAVPLGYYAIYRWPEQFAYRIHIGWRIFAVAGVSVVVVALLTMAFQTPKAAVANPAESLKSE